jgi:hypothetical protein
MAETMSHLSIFKCSGKTSPLIENQQKNNKEIGMEIKMEVRFNWLLLRKC